MLCLLLTCSVVLTELGLKIESQELRPERQGWGCKVAGLGHCTNCE